MSLSVPIKCCTVLTVFWEVPMLDLKLLFENLPEVKQRLSLRSGEPVNWSRFEELYENRKAVLRDFEETRCQQKKRSQDFKTVSRDPEASQALRTELKALSDHVADLEKSLADTEAALSDFVLYVPNIPHVEVPSGTGEHDNVEVRRYGEKPRLDFTPRPHWEIGESLGILDFDSAARISGSRFVLYRGLGARLELALAQFMMDVAEENGYTSILPPYLVRQEAMQGTGQLPKFAEDAFRVDDLYLIPTAEVPVTNMHRESILEAGTLPINYVAYSSCFRREAGAAGRDTRGITRLHQFQKVELVRFVEPEHSEKALEELVGHAEEILRRLGFHYRVMALCTGDLGFSATRCYDLEVWLPGADSYREISSCSLFGDFQARRAGIRYRPEDGGKPRFVHTLNGSGLAIGRTIVALLENGQQADGSVIIPEALRPYLHGRERISPPE
jgi:seryl-tRNA synthetase